MKNFKILQNNLKIKLNYSRIISYMSLYGIFGLFNFIFLKNYVLLISIIVFLLIPAISLILLIYLSNSLNINIFVSDENVTVGDSIGISIGLENNSVLSSLKLKCELIFENPFYSEKNTQSIILPVVAKSKNVNPFSFKTNNTGNIIISLVKACLYDLLGLFRIEINNLLSVTTTVVPENILLSDLQQYGIINAFSDNEDDSKRGNEFSDTSNIRQYIPGDRLKDVHWKLSSKKNEILVREHIRSCDNKLVLLIDYSNVKKENEKIIQLAYSVCNYCLTEGILITLLWNNNNNSLSNKDIDNKKDLIFILSELYTSINHSNIEFSIERLIQSELNTDKILRIGSINSEVNLYTYDI